MMGRQNGVFATWLDSKHANKDCKPNNCTYFTNIVIPGIPRGGIWTR
jgi:hypothetical protein